MNVREMKHMETQEDKHRLESVVCGNHVYKYILDVATMYIWTPCLGEQLSLCVDVETMLMSYCAVLVIKYHSLQVVADMFSI